MPCDLKHVVTFGKGWSMIDHRSFDMLQDITQLFVVILNIDKNNWYDVSHLNLLIEFRQQFININNYIILVIIDWSGQRSGGFS